MVQFAENLSFSYLEAAKKQQHFDENWVKSANEYR